MATQMVTTEELLKESEFTKNVLKHQIDRMYKELEKKDEEIRKLNMQLQERQLLLDSAMTKITLKKDIETIKFEQALSVLSLIAGEEMPFGAKMIHSPEKTAVIALAQLREKNL